MQVYLPAFLIFAFVMLGMALGVIFSGRAIKGSCGGLGNMRDELGRPMCECGVSAGSICTRNGEATFQPGADSPEPVAEADGERQEATSA